MVSPRDNTRSFQPWHKRRANSCTVPAHSMLVWSSFVAILLSLAFFIVVDATVPVALDTSLFNVRDPDQLVDGNNPLLRLGTFGYCITWEHYDSSLNPLAFRLPLCYNGNNYDTAGVEQYFEKEDIPFAYMARLGPATSSLHPLTTAFVSLVFITAALPCFVPAIFPVALSWLATASSTAAVGATFSLTFAVRSRVRLPYKFEFGVGIWVLLVGAIGIWVFAGLLTTAWFLRRRSGRRNVDEPDPVHHSPIVDASVESRQGELCGEPPVRELIEGPNAHRHELLNTDRREQGRMESGAAELYELDSPERSRFIRNHMHTWPPKQPTWG